MDNFNNDFNNFEGQPNHEANTRYGARDSDYNRNRYNDEEFAAEFIADDHRVDGNSTSGAMIAGALGILAALVAMFMHPVLLGLIGTGLGLYAFAKGNKIVGMIAVAMGLIAAAFPLLHTGPFFSMFS